ncbi:MAG: DUF2955 domain-containing protein [Longimicrobiales bacterium]
MSASLAVEGAVLVDRSVHTKIFRLAFGMTVSSAVAFGIAWPVSFLTPALTAKLLTMPQAIKPKAALGFLVVLAACLLFSTLVLLPLLDYPAVHLLITALLLYLLFYAKAGGTQPVLVVLMIISVLAVPLIGTVDPELASAVSGGLFFCAAVAIAMVFIAIAVFPDLEGTDEGKGKTPAPAVRSKAQNSGLALRSLVVLYPLAIALQMFSLTGATVALIMAILLSLEPTYGKHLKAGAGLILANLAGGLASVAIYQLLVYVPSFGFLLVLITLAGLWMGKWIFSPSRLGKLLGAGIMAFYVVLGPSITGSDDAAPSLLVRLMLIQAAVVYVVLAFGTLERITRGRRRLAA